MSKQIYVTYCSAEKNTNEKEMNAIDRYVSERIRHVQSVAKQDRADFMILSGEFGLLNPKDKIPFYDHLLKPFETTRLSKSVARQLKSFKGKKIVMHTHWMDRDINVAPYIETMTDACELAKLPFDLVILDEEIPV
ncbi:MAG: DUF6884 domain-containing protein [Crocinitomicaceae bacterium]